MRRQIASLRERPSALLWIAAAATALIACGDGGGFTLGPQAQVDWSPKSVGFGDVPRGAEANTLITVRHVGTGGTIKLSPIELISESPDLKLGTIEATELEPGGESRIQVVYSSNDDLQDEGVLRIRLNIASTPLIEIPISTPGQRAQLVASPGAVDFGVVQAGAPKSVWVTVSNVGTAAAEVDGFAVDSDEDGDFAVVLPGPVTIEPGQSEPIQLEYSPTGKDDDEAVIHLTTPREDVSLAIPVEGEEETPELVVEPGTVQFGWVEPGSIKLVTLKLRNEGNTDLTVNSFDLDAAVDGLGITSPLVLPLTLEPGALASTGLLFQPVENLPMTGEPIATITMGSTDEANHPLIVSVFGAAGVPGIYVSPESVVDFAYVAESFTATRTVTVLNVGDVAVDVTGGSIAEATTEEFSFANPEILPATLNPGENVVLELAFHNTLGDDGTEFARFLVNTSDPLIPEYPLDVVARRSEKPTCEPAFVPDLLNMGAFKTGGFGLDEIHVVNYGSGNCEYREYELDGCTKVQSGTYYLFECDPNWSWTPFIVEKEPQYGDLFGPGESLTFQIRFDAPEIWDTVLGRDVYFARLALMLHDPNEDWFKYVTPEGGWMKGINLRAESALPMISVDPPTLGFGNVRTGCESDAGLVTVTNLGPMAAVIGAADLVGCGSQMVVKNLPPLPYTLPGYGKLYLEVAFAPETGGDQACIFHLETDALNVPVADLDLSGHGVDIQHHIDVFEQAPSPKVDVLFVIDDSGSMADEQQKLKEEMPKLVEVAAQWSQDFHMAITTTDPILVAGKFKGKPPIAAPGTDMAAWAKNMQVGTAGHWEEMGLEGAWSALSGTNVTHTEIPCENKPNACPQGLWCIEGFCQGVNSGFLRDDADLVLIIVSDEEDSSPMAIDWYVDHLADLKDPQSGVGLKIHVIVIPYEGCFGVGWGSPGTRYLQAAKQTQGVQASICADDFSSEYEAISQSTFGLKDQFYPSLPPDEATLQVRVDGVECDGGWTWNETTQAVVFDKAGSCWPDHGAIIELEYDVRCKIP